MDSKQSDSQKLIPMPRQSLNDIGQTSSTMETFEISEGQRLDTLISLQEAFRVSLSQVQGNGTETAIKDSYGRSSLESSAKYDHDSHSLRTYQGFFQLTEGEPSTEFLATFPRSGMIVSGTLYQLAPLVRITNEIGFGLLPTPDTMPEAPNSSSNVKHRPKSLLECARQMWPTPRAMNPSRSSEGYGETLNQIVQQKESKAGGQLNPTWVEWLMGFPTDHTALDASETELFLKSRKSSLKKSRLSCE